MSLALTLVSGCGNARVAFHGIVNIIWTGMPKACAQCTCAKDGGFAMIAFATNGSCDTESGETQELQQPRNISYIMRRFRGMSPPFKESRDGSRPGLRTMY
jgi:hypothetical protein